MRLFIGLSIIALVVGIYLFSPLTQYMDIDRLQLLLTDTPDNWRTTCVSMVLFLLGGILLIPVPLMSFGLSLVFPFWKACLLAVFGSMLAASSGYLVGRFIKVDSLGGKLRKYLDKIKYTIDDKEEFAIIALRVAPTPPFTVTSLLAGSLRLNYIKFVLYSCVGIAPLMYLTLFMGQSFLEFLKKPSGLSAMLLAATVIVFIGYKVYKNKYNSNQNHTS